MPLENWIVLAVIAAGVAYFAWQYYQRKAKATKATPTENPEGGSNWHSTSARFYVKPVPDDEETPKKG